MDIKKLRQIILPLHRWIGLIIGPIFATIGLTGSVMVFGKEIDEWLIRQQFGSVIVRGKPLSIEQIFTQFTQIYRDLPNLQIQVISTLAEPNTPYRVLFQSATAPVMEAIVNPYSGSVMGTREAETTLIRLVAKLHHELLAGTGGEIVVGLVGLVLLIAIGTGLALSQGWKRLTTSFVIKWSAPWARLSRDLHKTIGIVVAFFLMLTVITGCFWNFWGATKPSIFTATVDITPPSIMSKSSSSSALSLPAILRQADAVLPTSVTTFVVFPQPTADAWRVGRKFPQEQEPHGLNYVDLDRTTGKVLASRDALNPVIGEAIVNAFKPIHRGSFGGLATRILYLFIGLSPTVLFATSLGIWWQSHRRKLPHKSLK